MKKYGYFEVIGQGEYKDGVILENTSESASSVVASQYYENEYKEKEHTDLCQIDIVEMTEPKTEVSRCRKIKSIIKAESGYTGKIYLSEGIYNFLCQV